MVFADSHDGSDGIASVKYGRFQLERTIGGSRRDVRPVALP